MLIHPSSVAVSREHRRAKTDRLDTELLKRGFLGWLRGERGHCTMARIPTIAEEDAKAAQSGARSAWSGNARASSNRMKGTLARLGIRNFKPTLRKAAERLATLHTAGGSVLPPNCPRPSCSASMARLGRRTSARSRRSRGLSSRNDWIAGARGPSHTPWYGTWLGSSASASKTADMLVNEVLSRPMRDRKAVARYAGLTGSPDEERGEAVGNKGSPKQAMPGSAAV